MNRASLNPANALTGSKLSSGARKARPVGSSERVELVMSGASDAD